MEQKIVIGEGSALFHKAMSAAANAGLLPAKENGHLDGDGFMKLYGAFTSALTETAQAENWPVTFQVSR